MSTTTNQDEPSAGTAAAALNDGARPTIDTAGGPVEVHDVAKSFDGVVDVLSHVDLSVGAGATLALLGPSGCGKTTLLRVIAGLETPDSGTVVVAGRTLNGPGTNVAPEKRRIGMVFQDWALFPHLSVARNVGFGLGRGERRDSPRIDEALEIVGLGGLGDRMPASLSGGQQQRVALARAIAPRPSVLLLDEPFSNLDAALRVQVRTEIHALLADLAVTTVFVTHDQDEAFVLGDEVAVLHDGRIVQVGPPEELYRRPANRWLADFVGDANFLPGTLLAITTAGGATTGRRAGTALGKIEIEIDPGAGDRVEVLVRPEDLDLVPPDDGDGSTFDGVVGLVEYMGHSTSYVVHGDVLTLRVRVAEPPRWRRGERVTVVHRGGTARAFTFEP